MRTKPGSVTAARGKRPYPRYPITAIAFDRLDPGAGTPGKHRTRIAAEDRVRYRQVEIGGRHRPTPRLAETPGGRSGRARDDPHHTEKRARSGLRPGPKHARARP